MEKYFTLSVYETLNPAESHGLWNENRRLIRWLLDICRPLDSLAPKMGYLTSTPRVKSVPGDI